MSSAGQVETAGAPSAERSIVNNFTLNVATVNGTQVDAYIRIDAITNAVLGTIDNNAPTNYSYVPVAGSAV